MPGVVLIVSISDICLLPYFYTHITDSQEIPYVYAYSSETLLMNTLNSDRVNPLPSSMYRSYNRIPQSKSMHIMPMGHIETDPSTSS